MFQKNELPFDLDKILMGMDIKINYNFLYVLYIHLLIRDLYTSKMYDSHNVLMLL